MLNFTALSSLVTTTETRPNRQITSPLDGSVIGSVPVCTTDDVAHAAQVARRAQRSWAATPVRERARVFARFARAVLNRQSELLDLIQTESGKNRLSAFEEVIDVSRCSAYYSHNAERFLRPTRRQGALPVLTRTIEHYQPKGLIAVISPWNYPFTLAITDAVAALLAGNAVIIKPDSQTPFTALAGIQMLFDAGLPRDLFQIVTGPGRELGSALIEHSDYLMFTGSTATGRTVAEQCARRLIGFSAELGGKNPLLILSDADIERAAIGAVRAAFSTSGQLCISTERAYIHQDVWDEFVPAFVAATKAMTIGPELSWNIAMGSLASAAQLDTVTTHVTDAVTKGATVLAGGRARPDLGPYFYEPTVLTDMPPDATAFRSETFGPVIALYKVASDEEAIERANDTEYGLHASVWSRRRGVWAARQIRSGTVSVNEGYASSWASHDAPMGGMKASGVGRRHGRDGLLKYTEPQAIAVQRLLGIAPPPGVAAETFAKALTFGTRLMNWIR